MGEEHALLFRDKNRASVMTDELCSLKNEVSAVKERLDTLSNIVKKTLSDKYSALFKQAGRYVTGFLFRVLIKARL
jgi:hypothetical protein